MLYCYADVGSRSVITVLIPKRLLYDTAMFINKLRRRVNLGGSGSNRQVVMQLPDMLRADAAAAADDLCALAEPLF